MIPYYQDYFWANGKPIGINKCPFNSENLFRIVTDPYQKWFTIEAYSGGKWVSNIYDSRFLDFRKLKPTEQMAWRREEILPGTSLIFNEDDRLILKEVCETEEGLCKEVAIYSLYETLICRYLMPDGPLGTLTLNDPLNHIIMTRTFNDKTQKFNECWSVKKAEGQR